MKKTLLFSSLVIGVALVGCNRETRTSTAATDTTTPAATTTDTTAATTSAEAARRDMANDVRRGADATAAATREAGRDVRAAATEAGREVREFGRDASAAMARAGDKIEAKYQEWKLNAQDLEADLAAKRPIVRTKSVAGAATGNVDRSTLKSAVEGRIKADSELSNLKLDINAKSNGEIELEGKALNAQQIARAMGLALDTEGVQKVTSKIDIDEDAVKRR